MGPGAAAKGRRAPAGAVPGPRLALVALVAAVFEPFRAISADHVGRRNSHLRRYVGAQRLVEGGLETMGPTRKCSRRPESVARAADKLTNLCDKLGRKMLTFCVFSGALGWSDSFSAAETAPLRTRNLGAHQSKSIPRGWRKSEGRKSSRFRVLLGQKMWTFLTDFGRSGA